MGGAGFRDATIQLSTLPGRQYLEWIQVSDMILPNTSPCLEGSTEQSDGSLGHSLRKIAMVAQITDMANR